VGKLRFPPPNSPLSFRDFPAQGRDPATGKLGLVDLVIVKGKRAKTDGRVTYYAVG
jgi:hypothetical protein